jgi:hypothetical protein
MVKQNLYRYGLITFFWALCIGSVSPVIAQSKSKANVDKQAVPKKATETPVVNETATEADTTKVKVERGADGKKVYKIEGEIVIEGKIQKPEAFYVLQKSGINYDWHELKQEFVPKILDSVTKAPF